MSKEQTWGERLSAAAEEKEEYEEELCDFKDEIQKNHRHQQDTAHSLRIVLVSGNVQENTDTPGIKEEPEEQSIIHEEEQLPMSVPELTAVCVKKEETSPLQQIKTEHQEETQREDVSSETDGDTDRSSDADNDWEPPFSCSAAQNKTEANGNHCNQLQTRNRNMSAQTSGVSSQNKSVPEISFILNCGDMSDSVEDAKLEKDKCLVSKKTQSLSKGPTGEKPYSCSICLKTYKRKFDLNDHMGLHIEGEKTYSCSVCMKTFSRRSKLYDHRKVHKLKKRHDCSVCKKTFTSKTKKNEHMRSHTGERPYSCSICEQTFNRSDRLNEHMSSHTGEKPYSCSVCHKTFSLSNSLYYHKRTHTGVKPYSCSICQRDFAKRSDLTYHVRKHTGERPYSCPFCDKTFTLNCELTVHARAHTGEKPYSCTVCEKSFCYGSSLRAHMRTKLHCENANK